VWYNFAVSTHAARSSGKTSAVVDGRQGVLTRRTSSQSGQEDAKYQLEVCTIASDN